MLRSIKNELIKSSRGRRSRIKQRQHYLKKDHYLKTSALSWAIKRQQQHHEYSSLRSCSHRYHQNFIPSKISASIPNIPSLSQSFSSSTRKEKPTSLSTKEKSIEDQYSRKTPLEHILLRPGMYVGPVERSQPKLQWVPSEPFPFPFPSLSSPSSAEINGNIFNDAILSGSTVIRKTPPTVMVQQKIPSHPALIKIFDEIIVNAFDNRLRKGRTASTTKIDVILHPGGMIDIEKPSSKPKKSTKRKQKYQPPFISITNNGKGIPIQIHKKEKMYLPEMLFGHLLTGSNFDDVNEKKLTGGRHGYGAKLTNIFSKAFKVETVDSTRNKKYTQLWEDNMRIMHDPMIIDLDKDGNTTEDYTKISFVPDLDKKLRFYRRWTILTS